MDTQATGDDYFQLALNIQPILTMINTQYYNSGSTNGCDGNVYPEGTENFMTRSRLHRTGRGALAVAGRPRAPRVFLGRGQRYVAPSVVNDALDCLATGANCGSFVPPETWPGIRGVMTWSINWDAANGYNFANTIAPHLSALP